MSAIFSKNENTDVFLFEGNEKIGKKIYISGKGRCNITNSKEIYEFFDEINRNKNFLYSSLYSFTNEDILRFFNENGLRTKVERGGRVFPVSDKSSDVIKVLEKALNVKGVKIILNTEIEDVKLIGDKFQLVCNKDYGLFDKVIFATGGKSYPFTGSRGKGHEILKKLGHTITDLKAGLVGIDVKENIRKYSGVSLKFVDFKIYNANRKLLHSEFGEMIFTHTGFSGPIVLKSSKYFDNSKNFFVSIDLKPKLDQHTLDLRLLREFDQNKNKNLKKLVETIKNLKFNFKSLRPLSEAIITIGGVSVKEINSSTMESKLIKNLYIVGELLDVDANTGGYNLTIAFSTGHLAGVSCIEGE